LTTDIGGSGWPQAPSDPSAGEPPLDPGAGDERERALLAAIDVEEAEVDRVGVLAEDGEVHPGAVPGGTEGIGRSAPDAQVHAAIRSSALIGSQVQSGRLFAS